MPLIICLVLIKIISVITTFFYGPGFAHPFPVGEIARPPFPQNKPVFLRQNTTLHSG